MSREADKSLKGFVYQFIKTLNEILISDDNSIITVEGIIEDIDITSDNKTKAIQCKYHESKESYSLSDIYKPVLQFLKHYSENQNFDIQYILYAYFPNESEGKKTLTIIDLNSILKTENTEYISKYISLICPTDDDEIKKLVKKLSLSQDEKNKIKSYYSDETKLKPVIDLEKFLNDKFVFYIGKSFENLKSESIELFKNERFNHHDIEDLFLPNAIQKIVDLSIKHDANERKTSKNEIINDLRIAKKTAITRWTKEISDTKQLLKKRRQQLTTNLNNNNKKRCFLLNPSTIDNFNDKIINFIQNYINQYSYKPKLHHQSIPIFCVLNKDDDNDYIFNLSARLYSKNIDVETGCIGKQFFRDKFIRVPKYIENQSWLQFQLRLCTFHDDVIEILNSNKPDDLFIINEIDYSKIDSKDINIEIIEIETFDELEFLLQLKKEI